jgi:hypothetical protein
LAVSTTAERAAEIEGDLIEQSCTYGKWWMRRHVLLVALALAGRALSQNLIAISLLCVPVLAAVYLSVMVSELVFVGPVGTFLLTDLAFSQNLARLAVLCLDVPPLAFLIGFALVRLAPVLGVRAAVAVTLAYSMVRTAVHLFAAVDGLTTFLLSLMKIGMEIGLMAAPLLCGSIFAYRGLLERGAANRYSQSP